MMPPFEFDCPSLAHTREFGRALADVLQAGDVVALEGNLGAGKTHLTQAVGAGLGIDSESVLSPTFTVIQEYAARIALVHIDAYRLRDVDEFLELGADELLGADNICLIEWASRVIEALPHDRLTVNIQTLDESSRRITITASGPKSQQRLNDLQNIIA